MDVELPWSIITSSLKKRPLCLSFSSLLSSLLSPAFLSSFSASLPTSKPHSRHQVRFGCHCFDIFVAVRLHTNHSSCQTWRGGKLEGHQMTKRLQRKTEYVKRRRDRQCSHIKCPGQEVRSSLQ